MTRPLVVTFLDHSAQPSGGEIALLRLCDALRATDEVVPRVVLGEDGPLAPRLRDAGVQTEILSLSPTTRVWQRSSHVLERSSTLSAIGLVSYALRLSTHLRRCDVVHSYSLKANLYGGLAARLAGKPHVWQANDQVSDVYFASSAVAPIRMAARLLPKAIVANSASTLGTVGGRGHVLYPALPRDLDGSFPAHRSEPRPLTIGMIGRLAPWKGQDVFLRAFAAAFAGTDVRAVVAGGALFGESDWERAMHELSAQLGVHQQVEFLGHVDDVADLLRRITILVHCSTIPEPFGQVVSEGMAAGLCIVAADAGGPAEILSDGRTGVLTPPGDVGRLADALRHLAVDPAQRRRLGEAAQVAARAFEPLRIAADHVHLYRSLAEKHRSRRRIGKARTREEQ